MLTPHPYSSLEYWFFKVNSGQIALLVDWISKRNENQNWLRVSIHSPTKREVLFERLIEIMPGDNYLNLHRTVGHLNDVAWDLAIDPGNDLIKPDIFPIGLLRMTDLLLVSAPLACFSGWIRHRGIEYILENTTGMISHYWGRQLASDWWWVSANQFDKEDISVECSLFHTNLWGTSLKASFAYLYLRQHDKKEFVVVPAMLASVKGTPENFEIEIKRIGKESVTLTCSGYEYGDFNDGIVNTLIGDLEVRIGTKLIARAMGTAGLEHRFPQNASQ